MPNIILCTSNTSVRSLLISSERLKTAIDIDCRICSGNEPQTHSSVGVARGESWLCESELSQQRNVVGRKLVAGQCVVPGDELGRWRLEDAGKPERTRRRRRAVPDVVEAQLVNADPLQSAAVVTVRHRRLFALRTRTHLYIVSK